MAFCSPKFVLMITISGSMEWVYHDRGKVEASLVRKYQEICWNILWRQLRPEHKLESIIYELNSRWLPDGKQIVLVTPKDPVAMVSLMKNILAHTNYDIKLTIKDDESHDRILTAC